MSAGNSHRGRGRRRLIVAMTLLGIALLVVGLYLWSRQATWPPRGFVGHGELIDPPAALPNVALPLIRGGRTDAASPKSIVYTDPNFFRRKWTLLYWGQGLCPESCRTSLDVSQQVRNALDRNADQVQRVFIADGVCCEEIPGAQQDLITVRAGSDASPLLALLSRVDRMNASAADRMYLIDPSGRLVISYAPNSKARDLLEDLKRLMGSFRADSVSSASKSTGVSSSGAGSSQIED